MKKRLTEYAGNGFWSFVTTEKRKGRSYTQIVGKDKVVKEYQEVIIGGWLLMPGILPVYAEGTAPMALSDVNDPRFSEVIAFRSAESNAIKSAGKHLGIGADVREEEGGDAAIKAQQTSCKSMFDKLIAMDEPKKKAALKAVMDIAPHALKGEVFSCELLSEDNVDAMVTALSGAFVAA